MNYLFADMETKTMEFNHELNMQKIRELINTITLNSSIVFEKPGTVVYQGIYDNMEASAKALMHNDKVAVAYINMPANYTYPPHAHEVVETLCIFGGEITFVSESKGEITLGVGDVISFGPNEKHSNTTINGCQLIAITVPAAVGYPKLGGDI